MEELLESANLIVHRIEAENDIGRDLHVDVVEGTDVTGGVIGIQVKTGASFHHRGRWVLPGTPQDFVLWEESSVPMFGVVVDPSTRHARWVDLSGAAIAEKRNAKPDPYAPFVVDGSYGKRAVVVPESNRLDLSLDYFIAAAMDALRQHRGRPTYDLFSDDVERVSTAILDSFAVGRRDPRPLLLLTRVFAWLPAEAQRLAIAVLALTTRHPDIAWSEHNWIPATVKQEVRRRCMWDPDDVVTMLKIVDADEQGMERGTLGQSVYHVLDLDSRLDLQLDRVATDRHYPSEARGLAALVLVFRAAENAPEVVAELVRRAPDLAANCRFALVVEHVREFGYVSLF